MSLHVRLRHAFPAARVDIEFQAPEEGVTALFGPSGSGKSTIVAAAAGLLRAQECRVAIGETVLADTARGIFLRPEQRRVGVVFQDARLFPHMSVAANLRFGLRRAASRRTGFDDVVALLDIAPLLPRRPASLSGGERQRVAIGRALLAQSRLLLMDEPLASLDGARKAEILPYLARLKRQGVPILYVTHALEELLGLADHVVLLSAGQVVAAGPVGELATRPDLPLGQRDDAAAMLSCRVLGGDEALGLTRLAWGAATVWLGQTGHAPGTMLRLRLPARDIILARPGIMDSAGMLSLHNILPGTVRHVRLDAARRTALVEIATPDGSLLSRVTPDAVERLGLAAGTAVAALFKAVSLEILG